jgi:hypothetical protein
MRVASLSSLLLFVVVGPAAAQSGWSATLGTGYATSSGYDSSWDDGRVVAVRSAVWRRLGGHFDLGVEGGAFLYGRDRRVFTCTGPSCGGRDFTSVGERTSWAWTGDLALRWRMGGRSVRPHATLGLGVGERRDPFVRTEYDTLGVRVVEDYTTSTSLLPVAALGFGLEIGPPSSRLAVTTGIRGDFAFDGYDGTPAVARLFSIGAGVTLR